MAKPVEVSCEGAVMETPWHPFLVHFAIAAWPMGTLLYWFAWLRRKPQWLPAAWFCFTFAFFFAILAALSGQSDWSRYAADPHPLLDQHRDLGNALPWLMGGMLAARLHAHLTAKIRTPPHFDRPPVWACASLFIGVLLILTGFLGGSFVYSALLQLRLSGAP